MLTYNELLTSLILIMLFAPIFSGVILALDKFKFFQRFTWSPCYFCILFWLSLIAGNVIWFDHWYLSLPIAFGAATSGRSLFLIE